MTEISFVVETPLPLVLSAIFRAIRKTFGSSRWPPEVKMYLQERAYTSPIWYTP